MYFPDPSFLTIIQAFNEIISAVASVNSLEEDVVKVQFNLLNVYIYFIAQVAHEEVKRIVIYQSALRRV